MHFSRTKVSLTIAIMSAWLSELHQAVLAVDGSLLESLLHFDTVTFVMLTMISLLGGVLLAFSKRYLAGDPTAGSTGLRRFRFWILATLGSVALLVMSGNLLLLAAAWVGISLSLHQLLTFYSNRPRAIIAAHKKFIASRSADLSLLAAILLVGTEVGSFQIERLWQHFEQGHALTLGLEIAAVLFVFGACLKCAQLPFHGWLTQVMEAPTPVSALLHAGVVNMGGFLMIRLAPLMSQADAAQTLLVAVGTVSAVGAALVMMTQSSVKVTLAWSTCAQMGFMLIQCGFGAYELALLHLVAHSLYKAYAFLRSGSVVDQYRASLFASSGAGETRQSALSRLPRVAAALGASATMTTVLVVMLEAGASSNPSLWAFFLILALALTSFFAGRDVKDSKQLIISALSAAFLGLLYFSWHSTAELLLPRHATLHSSAVDLSFLMRLEIAGLGFAALLFIQAALLMRPKGKMARLLFPLLYEGFYLDAWFTRLTFWLWPLQLPADENSPLAGESALAKDPTITNPTVGA